PAGRAVAGYTPDLKDPDGDWREVQGFEDSATGNAWIFKNNKSSNNRQVIVVRHEVGHASDHVQFGINSDHATSGLMHPNADQQNDDGSGEFSDDSILRLRGWRR